MSKCTKSRAANKLKNLYSKRNHLANVVASLGMDPLHDKRKYKAMADQLQRINQQISNLQAKQITMSEHALLRYVQYAIGIDLDAICASVMTPELKKQIETLGDGVYPIGGGFRARVLNKTIVTVLDK
jgi:hypothetical protein